MIDLRHPVYAVVFSNGATYFNVKLTQLGMADADLVILNTVDEGLVVHKSRCSLNYEQLTDSDALFLIAGVSYLAARRDPKNKRSAYDALICT